MNADLSALPDRAHESLSKPRATSHEDLRHRRHAALHQALALRCSETDDSSDDTSSNDEEVSEMDDDDDMDDDDKPDQIMSNARFTSSALDVTTQGCCLRVRLPSSFSQTIVMDRRVSSASQRNPHSPVNIPSRISSSAYNSARVAPMLQHQGHQPQIHGPRGHPTWANMHAKARPAPVKIDLAHHANLTPRIEIEQVYDGVEEARSNSSSGDPSGDENNGISAPSSSARLIARTRMMQAIGRNRQATMKRSESMDVVIGRDNKAKEDGDSENVSPAPCTPGTAFHQRSVSCPTPKSPQLHQFGQVQVMVTPPTPRPQGSPIIGVFIRGVHPQPSTAGLHGGHDDMDVQGDSRTSLAPPEFELAPGRAKLMQAQRLQTLALMAWQQEQQQISLERTWSEALQQQSIILGAQDGQPTTSPTLMPGSPCLSYGQHVHTLQEPGRSPAKGRSPTSWWRELRSAPLTWNGSSASAYSQEGVSAQASCSPVTSTAKRAKEESGSAADKATTWRRRKSVEEESDDSSCTKINSAPAGRTRPLSQPKVRFYVPPAKRGLSSGSTASSSGLMSRKEGAAAAAAAAAVGMAKCLPNAPVVTSSSAPASVGACGIVTTRSSHMSARSHAAQSMIARISNRTALTEA